MVLKLMQVWFSEKASLTILERDLAKCRNKGVVIAAALLLG